jgi:predicted kinase
MSVITSQSNSATSALIESRDIDRVRAMLGPVPPPRAWPALVVLVGPPGSGKSTLTHALAERLPVVKIDGDRIRDELFAAPDYSFGESQRVGRAVRALIGELLDQRITVVYDDSNLTEWERQPLYTLANMRNVRLVIVHVTAPVGVILDRIRGLAEASQRETTPLLELYERMVGRYEPIPRPHLTVDTSSDTRQFIEGVILDLEEG